MSDDRLFELSLREAAGGSTPPDLTARVAARVAGEAEAPAPADLLPEAETAMREVAPKRRLWLRATVDLAAAAAIVFVFGWVTGVIDFDRDGPQKTKTVELPAGVAATEADGIEIHEDYIELRSGWFLLGSEAPPARYREHELRVESGGTLVRVGEVPNTDDLDEAAAWLQSMELEIKMLKQAKGWMARGGLALLVLSGAVLFDGERIEAQDEAALPKVSERHLVSNLMDIDRLPDDVRWVRGINLKDAHLEFLVLHKSIEILDLRGCAIGLEGITQLKELPKLRSLDLRGSDRLNKVNRQKAIRILTGMTGLTELGLDALPFLISKAVSPDTKEFAKDEERYLVETALASEIAKRFETLHIGECSVLHTAGFRKLVDLLPKVVSWDLTGYDNLTDEDLGHLAKKGHALSLTLTGCTGITELGLGFVARHTRIRELYLDGMSFQDNIDDAALFQIGKMAHLEYLILDSYDAITDEGVGYLGNLKKLQTLLLTAIEKVTGTGFKALARAPALKFLDLSSCKKITNDSIAHLASIKTLEVLDLGECASLNRSMLKHLAKLPALRELRLAYLKSAVDHMPLPGPPSPLAALHGLKKLRLLVIPLSANELRDLRKKLPDCKITNE